MRPSVYYNEIDSYCAAWLQNLMDADLIPRGDIDTRSIEDVIPNELRGYTQCHFFAGLGGWAYALQLAGWGTQPVWTGSCPCQPFSAAGKGAGFADERHLWPAWKHLIAQCRPAVVFGEQVASKDADPWIDLVHADLEDMGYAFGCVPFPAAGVGAPHIRDRNYWVADTANQRLDWRGPGETGDGQNAPRVEPQRLRDVVGLADAERQRIRPCGQGKVGETSSGVQGADGQRQRLRLDAGAMLDAERTDAGPTNGHWRAADWLGCTDGKWRPVESTNECMADGVSEILGYVRTGGAWSLNPLIQGAKNRVGRLRAYGNAICAPAAEAFIRSYLDAAHE